MVRKKRVVKTTKRTNQKTSKSRKTSNNVKKLEKQIAKDIKKAEKWVVERRKFFIKLAWVLGIIIALLIISQIYLKVMVDGV